MIGPVLKWMKSRNLNVKTEFVTPSGMCDLVGLTFKTRSVAKRLSYRQSRPIGSMSRAALLHQIPELRSITLDRLAKRCEPSISRELLQSEAERLVADRFIIRLSGERYRRINGWMPLQKRIIAVELKLKKVEEAMSQAQNNLTFADESYVALPERLAARVLAKCDRWFCYFESGVGVLSVSHRDCKIAHRSRNSHPDPVLQFYCAEKFWRTRS